MRRLEDTGESGIWMYWENVPGSSRLHYLDLCRDTIRRHAGDLPLRILDRESARQWVRGLNESVWEGLPGPVHRSDYIRTRLLYEHGGLWVDFDTIALQPLGRLLDPLADHALAGWGYEYDGRFFIGLFAARPASLIMADWVEAQDEVLARTSDWSTLSWSALGQDIMWPRTRALSYYRYPSDRVAPVPWYQWRRLLSPWESPRCVLANDPVTVVLWNSVMAPYLGHLSGCRALESRMLLGRLLRIALGRSDVEAEEDALTRFHRFAHLRHRRAGRAIEIRLRRLLVRGAR